MRPARILGTALLVATAALPAAAQRKSDAPFDAPVVIAPAVSNLIDLIDLDTAAPEGISFSNGLTITFGAGE